MNSKSNSAGYLLGVFSMWSTPQKKEKAGKKWLNEKETKISCHPPFPDWCHQLTCSLLPSVRPTTTDTPGVSVFAQYPQPQHSHTHTHTQSDPLNQPLHHHHTYLPSEWHYCLVGCQVCSIAKFPVCRFECVPLRMKSDWWLLED